MPCSWCYYSHSVGLQNKLLTSVFSEPFPSLPSISMSPGSTMFSGTLPITSPMPPGPHSHILECCPSSPTLNPLTFFHYCYSSSKPGFSSCPLSPGPPLSPMLTSYHPLADQGTGLGARKWGLNFSPHTSSVHNYT